MSWSAITYVSSGVTLAAFIVATIAWIAQRTLMQRERLIKAAPESARADLVARALEFFQVDTGNLTKAQQYDLAVRQIAERARRFRTVANIIVVLALVAAGLSGLAVWKSTGDDSERKRQVLRGLSADYDTYLDRVRNVCENIKSRRMTAIEAQQLVPSYNLSRQMLLTHGEGRKKDLRDLWGETAASAYDSVYASIFDHGGVDSAIYEMNVAFVDRIRKGLSEDYGALDAQYKTLSSAVRVLEQHKRALYSSIGNQVTEPRSYEKSVCPSLE